MAHAKQPVSIDGIEFDALISEDRTLEAEVPSYSVENGFSVADSVILNPMKLSMTLYVTNTPVTWLKKHGSSSNRVSNTIKKLEDLYFKSKPVKIVTTDNVYTNMAIESIGLSKSSDVGTSREIPISFVQVNVTSVSTTTIPSSYGKSGATKASAGTANTSSGSSGKIDGGTDYSGIDISDDYGLIGEIQKYTNGGNSSILYGIGQNLGIIKK